MSKFYCAQHDKYKAIQRPIYEVGDRMQYILKGHGGYPATNARGNVQLVQGNMIHVATDHCKNIKLLNQLETITPDWAPSPLIYLQRGKCWCPVVEPETAQQAGAQ